MQERRTRLEDAERSLLLQAQSACAGNRTHMADYIGVSIKTLYNWMKKYESEIGDKASIDRVCAKTATAGNTPNQETL